MAVRKRSRQVNFEASQEASAIVDAFKAAKGRGAFTHRINELICAGFLDPASPRFGSWIEHRRREIESRQQQDLAELKAYEALWAQQEQSAAVVGAAVDQWRVKVQNHQVNPRADPRAAWASWAGKAENIEWVAKIGPDHFLRVLEEVTGYTFRMVEIAR